MANHYDPGPATLRPDTPDTSIFNTPSGGPDSTINLPADIYATYPGYDGAVTIYHSQRSPELVSQSRGLIKLLAGNYSQIESQLKQTTPPTFKPAPVNPDFNPNDPNAFKPPPPPPTTPLSSIQPATSGMPADLRTQGTPLGPLDANPSTLASRSLNPLGTADALGRLQPTSLGTPQSELAPGVSALNPGTHLTDLSSSTLPAGSPFAHGPVTSFDPNALGTGGSLGLGREALAPGGLGGGLGVGPGGFLPGSLGNGVRVGPNGELLGPDGLPIGPPGTHLGPNGELLEPNGELLGPPGTRIGPNGELIGPNGELLPPGTRLGPNGTLIGPNGERLGPNGRPLGSGGTTGPNGQRMGPNGEPLGANGLPLTAAERAALGEQQGLAAAEKAALGERALLAEGAGGLGQGLGMGPGGMPMMPPMGGMGGMGGGQGDRSRTTWLEEDRDVWATDGDVLPGTIGRFDPDEE